MRKPGKAIRSFGTITAVGLFLVVLMGFVVTDTHSGRGCGGSWPLCHGHFVPAFAVHTLVEYSHRAVAAIVGLMVAGLGFWAWRWHGQRAEVRWFAAVGAGFVLIQGLLGGADVLWPESATVLALHFGFALIAFVAVLLLTVELHQMARVGNAPAPRARAAPRSFRTLALSTLGFSYLLVYWGAYVSHRDAGPACAGWPLCNGQVFPGFHGLVGVIFIHRLAALAAIVLMAWLLVRAYGLRRERPDIYRASAWLFVMVMAQAMSGALLVWTQFDLFANLLHVTIMTGLFGVLSYICLQSLPQPHPAAGHGQLKHAL